MYLIIGVGASFLFVLFIQLVAVFAFDFFEVSLFPLHFVKGGEKHQKGNDKMGMDAGCS